MNRIALLNLTKKTVKNYNAKIILNQNIAIYGNNCKFNGRLFNPQNVYFMDYSDEFMKINLFKLKSQRMYFTKMFLDCDIYVNLQNLLNTNLNTNVYINDKQYDKFMRRMENSTKYITGESYDNSAQVLPYDFNNMHFITEEISMGDKSYKVYMKSLE
jgi:hypothetical protein